jgi:signal peptidase I
VRKILWAIDIAVLVSWFFSSYLSDALPRELSQWTGFALLAGYLAVIWALYRPGRLRLRFDRTSLVAIVVGVVFVAVLYEPTLFVASTYLPSGPAAIGSLLAYGLLYGIFVQTFVFNLNTRARFDRSRPGTIVVPFLISLVLLLPLSTLQNLAIANPPEILAFVITDLFGGVALFVTLLLLYAKSTFNNLPGILFYLCFAIPTAFVVLLATNPVLELAWLFAAFGVVIVLIEILLPATWIERRLFPVTRSRVGGSHRGALFTIIAVVGIVAVALLVVLPTTLGTTHPFYADETGSMAPQIEPGSLLIVRHVNVDSIQVGQVLVFTAPWSEGLIVAHEVTAVLRTSSGLEFQTRGVANPTPDPSPVPAAAVIGVVALVIPWVGYLVIYSYIVLTLTAVALGAFVAYSISRPTRSRLRMPSRLLLSKGSGRL